MVGSHDGAFLQFNRLEIHIAFHLYYGALRQLGVLKDSQRVAFDVAELHVVGACRQILIGDDGDAESAISLLMQQMHIPTGIDNQFIDA